MAEWWEAAKAAVAAYTGVTPATVLFTVVAVGAVLYVAVSGLLAQPVPPPPRQEERAFQPLPPPVQLGEVTEEELRAYDGSDPNKPLLMVIKGQIYDVTQSRMFYGPGGPYALFAGRDASRALAKMSFEPNDLTGDISGLDPFEVEALHEWEYKFRNKYMTVGTIKKTIPDAEGEALRNYGASERDMDENSKESNCASNPTKNGATNQGGEVERPWEIPDEDVNTSSHEDVEKPKQLPCLDAANTSRHEESVKPEETTDASVKNKTSTEDQIEPKETPDMDGMEKATQAPDVIDVMNKSSHEDARKPKEILGVDEMNVGSHQDGEEKPKGTTE